MICMEKKINFDLKYRVIKQCGESSFQAIEIHVRNSNRNQTDDLYLNFASKLLFLVEVLLFRSQ